ncbi:unnamed protein product, partial [Phaeothamnion confervicola]
YASRYVRYETFWRLCDSGIYRDSINRMSPRLKTELGLYHSIRSVANPAARLAEFWATNLLGDAIDFKDGLEGALPLADAAPGVVPAVLKLWLDSDWTTRKSVWARFGTVMGDAPLEVVVDPSKGRLYLNPIDPRKVTAIDLDARGFVQGYEFQEYR